MATPAAPETAESQSYSLDRTQALYSEYVNPQWLKLMELLQLNVRYVRCEGAWLETESGTRVLDFLSGYCVHNVGHNHPRVVAAVSEELHRNGPAMLQSDVPDLAAELAAELCTRAGGQLKKVFFCSSGSEGVESAIKFARKHTGRTGLLYAKGAFHGLTCGALSMMGDEFWREGFGPMLPDTAEVPFGDLHAVEQLLRTKKFAALFLEPVQGEGGIVVPDGEYLKKAQALCRNYGSLLVLDEVQTGLGRTGKFLAAHHYGVDPDIVILAKALSGGLIPSAAVLMSNAVYRSTFDSLKKAIVHASTYSENALAMRAGLATLEVLQEENLIERAERLGRYLRDRLREALSGYEMVKEIRGLGLLCGIEFKAPKQLKLRVPFETFRKIHPGMFGQMVVMRMFKDKRILTQICGNNFMVLKAAPPLVVTEQQIDGYVQAVKEVVEDVHSSTAVWTDALGMARRAVNI